MNWSISVVSHGQGKMVSELLGDLRRVLPTGAEIILTLNAPEDETFLSSFQDLPIVVIRNGMRRGFGDNHNRAFRLSRGQMFAVVNPDIRLTESPFLALASACAADGVGACGPAVWSRLGSREDSARRFPTVFRIAARVVSINRTPDYCSLDGLPIPVDWVAGMFVVFNRHAFSALEGFDARYFMYYEDVDICRRLWREGWKVLHVPAASVMHDARRASHRDLRHLAWHIRSAMRFLGGF